MKVFAMTSNPDLATVYMADMGDERMIEFVEACQPPYGRDEHWILMVSTLFGCPVKCQMCDAGGQYRGKPTAEEMKQLMAQVTAVGADVNQQTLVLNDVFWAVLNSKEFMFNH